jgi:cytosine/adenosine deaminase-related metal-dependent hydrolase
VASPPIPNGAIRITDGRLRWIGPWAEAAPSATDLRVDLGDAALLPGLVNAHCHLDYTQLRGLLAPPRSFPDWIKAILAAKAAWSDEDFARSWKDGATQLLRHGTTTVANIETQTAALASLRSSTPLRLHSFLELTGVRLRRPPATLVDEAESLLKSLPDHPGGVGLSPHAPYSTVPELLSEAAARARRHGWRLTTHLAESREEFEMFMYRRGPMHDWLHNQRPDADCGIGSPIQHAERHGLLGPDFLAVHVNYLWDDDARILASHGCSVVHCPRSHAYFRHQRFPSGILADAGINLCLGTDSLASTRVGTGSPPELSMFSEMAAYAAHDNTISPADILRLATINGARALGLEQELGSLAPSLRADLCAIPVHAANDEIEDAVIHHTGPALATWIDGTPVWNLSGVPGPSPEQ